MHPARAFLQPYGLPFALLLSLCAARAEEAAPLVAVAEKPVERSIAAAVPPRSHEKSNEKSHETPNAPAAALVGTTSLTAPDDERPLRYIAPDGRRVSKGELLAFFENSSLHTALEEAKKELKACKAAIAAAEAQAADLEATAGEKIAAATYEIAKADKALSKYVEGDAPAAEIALTLALAEAEANFKQQTERYDVRDKMLAEGYIHKIEYDNEERLLEKTRLLRDAAKLKLTTFLKYDREQTVEQLTRAVADKKAVLEKLQKEQEAAVAKAQLAIEACGKAETAKTRECEALLKQIESTIILAAREGTFRHREGSPFTIGKPLTRGLLLGTIEK